MKANKLGRSRTVGMGLMCAVLVAGGVVPGTEAGPVCKTCKDTADWVRKATLAEDRSDFLLAYAQANNNTDILLWLAIVSEANATFHEETGLAQEQYSARVELCKDLGECTYNPVINPADFLTPAEIAANPNPFMPLQPGTVMRYQAVDEDGTEVVTVRVTEETRVILGVTCMVVHDQAALNGDVIEDTYDWFAQDIVGNVWYFGEQSLRYEHGVVEGNDGSWEGGVERAFPGIIMPANPAVGMIYRQEYALGEAEDAARVIGINESVTVTNGTYTGCLKTAEFSPMEPDHVEHKYFAPGVGLVLAVDVESGAREELISITTE